MTQNLIVVIPTSGRPSLLARTLKSLEQCRKPDIFIGTIVVENGPKTEVDRIIQSFSETSLNIRYFYSPIGNKSSALNIALEHIENSLIFFTDDDVTFNPEILLVYADAACGIDGGVFFGGRTKAEYEQEPQEWLKKYLPYSVLGLELNENNLIIDTPSFLGCNWAAYSNDIRMVGWFNPEFGPGSKSHSSGQETYMQKKLLENGVRGMYLPEAVVLHFVPEERCSPKWVLKQKSRNFIWKGQNSKPWEQPIRKILWIIKPFVTLFHPSVFFPAFSKDEEKRFRARLMLFIGFGKMRGAFFAWKKHIINRYFSAYKE